MFWNKRGITIVMVIIWVVIIGAIVIYAPKIYNYYITENTKSMIKANIESARNEIKSQLINRHPVSIWNDIDRIVKELKMQNPVSKETQVKNGFGIPGAVVVYFDGVNTFDIDGIGPDGKNMDLSVSIKK
jgi:Tfp pilus assembly major pilin PilA